MSDTPEKRSPIERIFERCLWNSRLILVPAVVASMVAAVIMIIAGCADVILLVGKLPMLLDGATGVKTFNSEAILLAVAAIDIFLIGTVLLIFSIGLYELFISDIDDIDEKARSSKALEIQSLDHLKEKLGKVIIMVLVVTMFKAAMDLKFSTAKDLLMFGGAIVLASIALYVSSNKISSNKSKMNNSSDDQDNK